jgi:PRTRC genetic system protein A
MIPIHVIPRPPEGRKPVLPDGGPCFLVGAGGVYRQIENAFYTARVKAEKLAHLAEIEESVQVHVPKMPAGLFREVEAFFAAVYERHHGEAVVLLACNPASGRWQVQVPDQEVRGAHVSYDLARLPDPPEGFSRFGSVHSHASMGAFHSGTDDADELTFDGLHITIGHLDQPVRSYSARWVIAGKAFPVELTHVIEGEALPGSRPEWLEKVRAAPPPEAFALYGTDFPSRDAPGALGRLAEVEQGVAVETSAFDTPEEYFGYLEDLRFELDDRMREVAPFLENPLGRR